MGGDELYFPEPIIQHVQSFLTSKESARTTTLSSSWCGAWLTRPNLDFDQKDFDMTVFSARMQLVKLAEKTITRYEACNLQIDSFRLCMNMAVSYCSDFDRTEILIMRELIMRASKFGATRLSFGFMSREFVLPNEVFGSENLVELTLKGCKIDLGRLNRKVGCLRLQSLCLDYVTIESRDMFFRIISSFPTIEKLSLSDIHYGRKDGPVGDYVVGDGLNNLHRLSCLVLKWVDVDALFLGDLSSKFPSLKDLTLYMVSEESREDKTRLISSRSLERLDFRLRKISPRYRYGASESSREMFVFDVPRIRKFIFEGKFFPSMSFISTPRVWDSHVSIRHYDCPTTSWFFDLSKFITSDLSSSRISLSLHFYSTSSFDYDIGDIQSLPIQEIENLMIDINGTPTLSCYAILDALFRMCHPKLITQYASPDRDSYSYFIVKNRNSDKGSYVVMKNNNIDLLGQTLYKGLNIRVSTPCQFNYGLNDLKEVRAQIFDEAVSAWRDVSLDALSDYSKTDQEVDALSEDSTTEAKDNRKVRFQLDWQPLQLN